MFRSAGNTLCPEGRQGARSEGGEPAPKWAQGMRKPLQEEEHSAGQASEELGEVGWGQRRMSS